MQQETICGALYGNTVLLQILYLNAFAKDNRRNLFVDWLVSNCIDIDRLLSTIKIIDM